VTQCPAQLCCKRTISLSEAAKNALIDCTSFLVEKAERLVENLDSNIAESFVSILNMTCNGRRTNLQLRSAFQRQATLTGLTMARGYSWHSTAQRKAGLRPTNVLQKNAEYVNRRQKRAKENRSWCKRTRRNLTTAGNKKETTMDPCGEVLPVTMEVMIKNRLNKMVRTNIERAKQLRCSAQDAVGRRGYHLGDKPTKAPLEENHACPHQREVSHYGATLKTVRKRR
jgi:hypothetical protein